MSEIQVPIICGDKINEFSDYGDAIPENMVAEVRDVLGTKGCLISHDGLFFYVVGQGIDRGAIYNERWKRSFRVSGTRLIELFPDGSSVNIGEITGTDKCSFAYSFNSLMIVADTKAWRYDGTSLEQMTDPDLGSPIDVTWIDGYYFFTDGEYIYHTDINNEQSINPLKFATSEISPDPTKAVARTQDDLVVVFNRYTTEFFINQGNDNFAFSRINQKAINSGICGTHSWCEMDGNIFMLGGRKEEAPSLHILGAGQTQSISTRTIDRILANYTDSQLSSAVLECRINNRDKLIYVYLPNEVLLYNHTVAEKFGVNYAWTKLSTSGGKWRACNGIFDPLLNKWVYGDISTAQICYLDATSAAQYAQPVNQEFYSPLVSIESSSIDEVELNTVSGFQQNAVNMFISTTRDGAYYSKEWSREVAAPFEYSKRCIYRRIGYVRKNIGLKFRALTKEKICVGGLVIRHA